MNIRIFIKIISLIATLINLSLQGKTIESFDDNNEKNSELENFTLNKKISPHIRKVADQNSPLLLTNSSNSKKELEIQSEKQFEENNILNAEGNVNVSYKGNFLKADSLIYDKTNKIIIAKGNVLLNIGEQIFKMVSFKYDFNNKKGFLLDVQGLIKTDNLIDDLFSNFETSTIKKK